MEPCVMQPTPQSPFIRQLSQGSQGSDGPVVRRTLSFTPRSASLPMTPTVYSSQRFFSVANVGRNNGFLYPRSGSVTLPAASLPARQVSCGASIPSTSQASRKRTPKDALNSLRAGNFRFQQGVRSPGQVPAVPAVPFATIVACADCPRTIEAIFNAQPGTLFVTASDGCHASEGLLKKVELSIKLGSSLILVLAHKGSMALLHASERFLAGEVQIPTPQTATDMGPADASFVSESAMTRNVFQTMQFLLTSSAGLRQRVRSGELEVHGGMFEPFTKVVQFMGPVPGQEEFLTETETANAAKERSGTHETRETSETMPEAGAVFPDEEAPVAVEKAGDSISQRSQSHDGTSPGTDCGQSEPTSSQEDVAEVAELQAAEETAEVLEEVEEVEEVEDRDDRDQEAEKTSLQPEESQISQESGESSTTAPSQVSYVIGEHPSSLPVEASPAEEQALEQDERQARQAVESGGAVDETEAEVQRGHGDLQFDVQLLAANDMAEWNAEGETAEGKVLLGPYFSAAFEIWMHLGGNQGLQLLQQRWQSLSEQLSRE